MTGFTVAWHHAEPLFALPVRPSVVLLGLTIVTFVILLALYLTKILKYPNQVKAEYSHPIKLNFFPTVSIGLILISVALLPYSHALSLVCWAAGASLHLAFTLHVLSVWMHQPHFEVDHLNPAWFIPVVGNILVPVAGVRHASPEISWFFFSVGLIFWLVLLTIIFYRMLFHQTLPARWMPSPVFSITWPSFWRCLHC
ncbi:MAG: SLAC1 anion channel family protein [Marinobacter sp.]|uniref:SLAC1 anion channel family protein n=1 Tax=Marinobacter sp. TaxID=50741 RepID=UPI0039747B00